FLDRIVPWADASMARQLQRSLAKQGLTFRLSTQAKSAERTATGVRVTLSGPAEPPLVDADVVLVAVGRRPYTEGLGARELGVAYDEHGRIAVNERFETTVPGVYAVGDVIPGPMLAHKGEEDAIAAVEGMAGHPVHVDHDLVPNVVYTAPELASVGITEEEAKARSLEVRIGTFPFQANARARCLDETEGGVKIIADAASDRILGIHILGARASDLGAEAVLAMEYGASAEDIARTVHAHPTLAEPARDAALGVATRTITLRRPEPAPPAAAGGFAPRAAPASLLRLFLFCVWLRRRSGGCSRRWLLLDDLEQLDVELERGAGLDLRRRAAVTGRHVGGADELRLAAGPHQCAPLGPALDDLVAREGRRVHALDSAV